MKRTVLLALSLAAASGCRTSGSSSTSAGPEGPAHSRPGWIKSPEAIEGTIAEAWGINVGDDDRQQYLQSMYSLLGGTLVLNTKSLVDQPNELFVIALDNLSTWLAGKLLEKQGTKGAGYLFDGLGFSQPDQANCFQDDAQDWCDFQDGVQADSLTQAGVDPTNLPKEWKKRLMHNVQDVGEFMLLALDNTLKMPNEDRHAARYLIEEVFLKQLEGQPLSAELEARAWNKVVYTILMSGGFYLEAPAQGGA